VVKEEGEGEEDPEEKAEEETNQNKKSLLPT
jgi:hypothetical protein